MLLKNTYLDKSKVEGIGLFAAENIAKDEVIWKNDITTTNVYTKEEWLEIEKHVPKIAFDNIARFAYVYKGIYYLNLDDSRFMNHCYEGNMSWDAEKMTCYANRDILAGQELTINYEEFCDKEDTFFTYNSTYK